MSNLPPYLPTDMGITKAVLLLSNNVSSGPYAFQLPQCNITNNPYSGGGYTGRTGTFGLLNCIAIQNGAISAVVWFYEPPGGQGVLLSFQNNQYANRPNDYTPWLYVGTNSHLYGGDYANGSVQVSTSSAISPGWHMAVVEEYYSGGTYYLSLYLDGSLVGQSSTTNLPGLFGLFGPYPYNDIGTGFTSNWAFTNGDWFFFNGAIVYVALYNRVLSTSDVLAIYQGVRITSGLVAEYVGDNYNSSTGVWTDSSGNNYNITTTVVAGQYPPRGCTLWPVGDTGTLTNWPTC
jgi:hypothetical protein